MERILAAGHAEMPRTGPWTITVPGAVDAWAKLLERYGTLGLEQVLEPAIRYATEGFAVTPVIAAEWAMHASHIEGDAAARDAFLPGGRAPRAGEQFQNPEMAGLLSVIAAGGPNRFTAESRLRSLARQRSVPVARCAPATWPCGLVRFGWSRSPDRSAA